MFMAFYERGQVWPQNSDLFLFWHNSPQILVPFKTNEASNLLDNWMSQIWFSSLAYIALNWYNLSVVSFACLLTFYRSFDHLTGKAGNLVLLNNSLILLQPWFISDVNDNHKAPKMEHRLDLQLISSKKMGTRTCKQLNRLNGGLVLQTKASIIIKLLSKR